MSNFTRVYFPGLGIDFDLPSVAFTIGSYDIHFYGIIIAFGFMLAVLYGGRMAYKWRMSLDGMTDVLIWGTVFGIVCARAYYVIFEWSYYSAHPADTVQTRHTAPHSRRRARLQQNSFFAWQIVSEERRKDAE